MTRALIVYLSLGGTSARVARNIADGLAETGIQCDLHNLARAETRDRGVRGSGMDGVRRPGEIALSEYGLLGVGAPAHYYRAPRPVRDFVRSLPRLDGLPAFSFTLHGTYPGRTARDLRTSLQERGARHLGSFSCPGADRYVAYLRRGFLFSAGRPNQDDLASAASFGVEVGSTLAASPPSVVTGSRRESDVGWFYRLERLLTGPALAHHVYSRLFRVDDRTCTGCGSCERRCPTGNIRLGPDRLPAWGRDCLLCLYCEMICPEEAIVSPVGWPPFDAFVAHNVRVAAADPHVGHARVTHRRGRTHILGDAEPQ